MENFLLKICKCSQTWDVKNFSERIIKEVKEKIPENKKVLVLVSGGVDSTVCYSILNKAIGNERVLGLFIDNGLLRKDEFEFVISSLKENGFHNLKSYDASNIFLENLKEIYDPESKRKIIGKVFIEIQEKALKEMKLDEDVWLLGQGTIYPDVIESKGSKNAHLIKTHHNRVEAVRKLIEQGKVIEPLSSLYKDEVRKVGLELGLPNSLIWRHPFPGRI